MRVTETEDHYLLAAAFAHEHAMPTVAGWLLSRAAQAGGATPQELNEPERIALVLGMLREAEEFGRRKALAQEMTGE